MAQGCTIPCSSSRLSAALHARKFGDQMFERLPVVGGALALAAISPVLLLVAPAITTIVLAAWCIVGAAIVLGQSWLGAATPARQALPEEMRRLVEANADRIHVSRLESLRARAGALDITRSNVDSAITHLLLDLREATGEAWRCPCPKRRLPIPLPF